MAQSDKTPSEPLSEPLDAVSGARQWSKVSKKNNKNRSHFFWIGGGVFAVILVLAMSSGYTKNTNAVKTTGMNSNDYDSSLDSNMAYLKKLADQKPTVTFASNDIDYSGQPQLHAHESKEYVARQNAPTSMYSSPISQITNPTSGAHVRQVVFAGQGANAQFANSSSTTTAVQATRIPHPGFTIASGEFLHAVLETAITSDLPGMVRAVVSRPAYAYTGERTIIPAGSRLIGQYSSALVQGQNRVMIIWNRIILPSGIAVQLNSPGTDSLGRAGQGADSVNTHFFARFGESTLLSLIGAGAAMSGVSQGDQYNSASQYRMAIAQSFKQSAQQSLQGTLPMKPTLHIYQGANINVFVAHDLSFYNVLKSSVEPVRSMPSFVK